MLHFGVEVVIGNAFLPFTNIFQIFLIMFVLLSEALFMTKSRAGKHFAMFVFAHECKKKTIKSNIISNTRLIFDMFKMLLTRSIQNIFRCQIRIAELSSENVKEENVKRFELECEIFFRRGI